MKITPSTLKEFRNEFKLAVKELEKKHKVAITLGNINYSDNEFTSRVTVNNIPEEGVIVQDKKEIDFVNMFKSGYYDLKVEHLGKRFKANGETYIIKGAKPRSPKYPIIAANIRTGTNYKFGIKSVVNGLEK